MRVRCATMTWRAAPPCAVVLGSGERFAFVEKLDRSERKAVKEVLDALLLKHDAKKWAAGG